MLQFFPSDREFTGEDEELRSRPGDFIQITDERIAAGGGTIYEIVFVDGLTGWVYAYEVYEDGQPLGPPPKTSS